jgi:hypothetical protein
LIDHVIRYDLDGSTQIDFDPAGVRRASGGQSRRGRQFG